jgi:type VI secretion system secreted protein VgrG
VAVGLGVGVRVGTTVGVRVGLAVGVRVCVAVGRLGSVGAWVGTGLAVRLGVALGACVRVAEGEAVPVTDGEAVGVAEAVEGGSTTGQTVDVVVEVGAGLVSGAAARASRRVGCGAAAGGAAVEVGGELVAVADGWASAKLARTGTGRRGVAVRTAVAVGGPARSACAARAVGDGVGRVEAVFGGAALGARRSADAEVPAEDGAAAAAARASAPVVAIGALDPATAGVAATEGPSGGLHAATASSSTAASSQPRPATSRPTAPGRALILSFSQEGEGTLPRHLAPLGFPLPLGAASRPEGQGHGGA